MPKHIPDIPDGPAPIGPYSVATEAAGLVFISGQIPVDPSTGVGVTGAVEDQARRVLENLRIILEGLGLGLDDVVKTTIFLTDMAAFPRVNDVYGQYFDPDPPARATVEVAALPGGYAVEIEAIAAR